MSKNSMIAAMIMVVVLTAPFLPYAIINAKKKMDCPTVHMVYHSKEVVKILDKDGEELEWSDNLDENFPNGYNVVWVDPSRSLDQYLK